jgi:hypothetical protein
MTDAPVNPILNLYCDESCHLEHDGCQVMVLGAIGPMPRLAKKLGPPLGRTAP